MPETNARPGVDPATFIRLPGRPRRILLLGIFVLVAVLIAASGYLALRLTETDRRPTPLLLDRPDTVVADRKFERPIEIAADNVILRGVTVRTGGAAAISVRSGVVGTLIEDTDIHCTSRRTDGVAAGNYSALRVRVDGCAEAFRQVAGAPATILESYRDGEPYRNPAAGSPAPPAAGPAPSADGPYAPAVAPTPITYWPSAANTGVPVGTALRNSGSLSLRTAGQVVTGLNIVGCITVAAANVQILRSRITCTSPTYAIRTLAGTLNLLIQDVEINGTATNSASICCSDYTLQRGNVYNMIDGPRLTNNTRILDSYLHSLTRVAGSHNDILQSTGGTNILVRHNTLLSYNPATRDPFNSCVTIGSETSPTLTNMTVEDNYCNGGNYSIGISPRLLGANILFRNNKYGRDYRYGVVSGYNRAGVIWERATNVYFDNGLPVVI
ncbi:hypothetical protein [Plantactinospora sp. CA-290183]|uniref:hypothetical protein n=1 Tax=Plantactinospora sp. CA-290183 TaxID=3240006 RepID=UPI003D8F7FF8